MIVCSACRKTIPVGLLKEHRQCCKVHRPKRRIKPSRHDTKLDNLTDTKKLWAVRVGAD